MPHYDAIAILGGGVREGGALPSWVRRRLDLAVELRADAYLMPLSAGTTHRPPPLQENGFPILEAVAGAQYLIRAGVPAEQVLVEAHSYDTIGNAYFSRVLHVDPQQLRRLLVITSDWHMPRTRLAFDWVYSLTPLASEYQLSYRAVEDPEMDERVKQERWRKEQSAAASLSRQAGEMRTLKEFHRWLFTRHDAYNAEAKAFGGAKLDAETLQSY